MDGFKQSTTHATAHDLLGTGWIHDLEKLRRLEEMLDDGELVSGWRAIKLHNRQNVAAHIHENLGLTVDPESIFDVLVKRILEYKRQHLQVLHIITLYKRIQKNPDLDLQPRTFIFGGKAAPAIVWPNSSSSSFTRLQK